LHLFFKSQRCARERDRAWDHPVMTLRARAMSCPRCEVRSRTDVDLVDATAPSRWPSTQARTSSRDHPGEPGRTGRHGEAVAILCRQSVNLHRQPASCARPPLVGTATTDPLL
jgi:hypothetical protein